MSRSWSLGRWTACALVVMAAGVARADAFEDACAAAREKHVEQVTPGRREAILSEIIVMVPDDAAYRAAHGEVQTENGWRLAESVRGATRREELRLAAKKALADAGEPTEATPPNSVSAASLRWKGGVATAEVRAFSTTSEAEARAMARACQAVPDYLRVALDFETRVVPGLTLYALAQRSEAQRIFTTHPASDEQARATWSKYASLWIGNAPEVATYYSDGPSRLESVVSQEIVYLLLVEHAGELRHATWVLNGFDRRLAWELVGTRLTYSRTESEYAHEAEPWADWGQLTDDGWYERARESLEAASPADLAEILGRPMNLISIRDDVVLHALAAYYIEGRPEECGDLLASAAAGKGPHDALRIASNLDLEALRLRLIRWLRERKP